MISIGIDIVKIERIRKMCDRYGYKWWVRFVGCEKELIDAKVRKNVYETLAGKFSSKEAYIKAVSKYIKKPALKDVSILHDPEGRPIVISNRKEIYSNQLQLSISHEKEYAVAVVLFSD
ncbi:MAG: holo-ACP synthase [Caldisericia bacterium]|nr:holo-ACP synthase [Caldisericia bacterium]